MTESANLIHQILDDKYRIERQLSGGGMGTVFLATHIGTERPVAVKVIATEYMANAEFVERFRREAKAAGRLRHPNVVNVTDFGFAAQEGTPTAYLVMEYLDGCTLADVLAEEKRLSLAWTADIIEQVCLAIDVAHKAGIVHRDLKPENIWLEPNRRGGYTVKVLDFGLAKLRDIGELKNEATRRSALPTMTPEAFSARTAGLVKTEAATVIQRLRATDGTLNGGVTHLGTILGTPLYMSPEQCRGEAADARSDVYAIGVIAYQMLTGVTPFEGDGGTLLERHVSESPRPIRDVWKKVPRGVARVVMSALEKDPSRRPQSARAFASAFCAYLDGAIELLRRSIALYVQTPAIFVQVMLLVFIPYFFVNIIHILFIFFNDDFFISIERVRASITSFSGFKIFSMLLLMFLTLIAFGACSPVTTRLLVAPGSKVKLRPLLQFLRRRLRSFLATALLTSVYLFIGSLLFIVPGIVAYYVFSLSMTVSIIEEMHGHAVLRRSKELVGRIKGTVVSALILYILITLVPVILSIFISLIFGAIIGLISKKFINIFILNDIYQLIMLLFFACVLPIYPIFLTMLYFKARQAGGETLSETLAEFEAENLPRTAWQTKMLARVGSQQ